MLADQLKEEERVETNSDDVHIILESVDTNQEYDTVISSGNQSSFDAWVSIPPFSAFGDNDDIDDNQEDSDYVGIFLAVTPTGDVNGSTQTVMSQVVHVHFWCKVYF